MRKPSHAATLHAGLHRIERLRINAAERALARSEFERAEAFADRMASLVEHLENMLARSADTLQPRSERLE